MNCSKCGKAMAAGAAKCGACGTEASTSYSYDLAPDTEPEKKEEPAAFMLPPGVSAPPGGASEAPKAEKPKGLRDRPRAASLQGGFSFKKLGIGVAVIAIVVLLGMKMCSGPKVTLTMMSPKGSATASVSAVVHKVIPFQNVGEVSYMLKVEALDGDAKIAVPERGSRDKLTPEIFKNWTFTTVKKGETQTLEGKLLSGSYSLVITSDSKKPVKVKYEYLVK